MKKIFALTIAAALFAGASAQAADGFITRNAHLYAGRGEYPLVTTVPESVPVKIYGCTTGYGWCDVMWQDQRGWVRGNAVQYEHRGNRVVITDDGAGIDVPIITFNGGDYWDNYYRDRPFYRDHGRYLGP